MVPPSATPYTRQPVYPLIRYPTGGPAVASASSEKPRNDPCARTLTTSPSTVQRDSDVWFALATSAAPVHGDPVAIPAAASAPASADASADPWISASTTTPLYRGNAPTVSATTHPRMPIAAIVPEPRSERIVERTGTRTDRDWHQRSEVCTHLTGSTDQVTLS